MARKSINAVIQTNGTLKIDGKSCTYDILIKYFEYDSIIALSKLIETDNKIAEKTYSKIEMYDFIRKKSWEMLSSSRSDI